MATGGVLEIDAKFLKQLKDADNALNKISETSKKMTGSVVKWMQDINKDGVMPFYNHLQQLEQKYRSTASTFESVRGYKRFSQQAKKAADSVQKLMQEIAKSPAYQAKVESLTRAFKYEQIKKYGDTSKQAFAAFNRLYSDKGVQSLNNMNKVLHQLQDAQNKLNLRTEEGRRKYDELGKKIQKIQGDINNATKANDRFRTSQSRLLNTTDQLQRKLALLFSVAAIQGYVNKLVSIRKEFELQHKSLGILIQDKDKADELWNKTVALAVQSPFRVKQLITYTKQLAAYRIETENLFETTKRLADVSAGLGVDMQRLILAYGQVRSASFLRATELRQFTEAGIPMLDELSKYFTKIEGEAVSVSDVMERISKRAVDFKDVRNVFKKMTDEGGVFYNMQEQQARTLHGMISNLYDSIDLMLNDIGKSNEDLIKGAISTARDLTEHWRAFSVVLKMVGASMLALQLAQFRSGWIAVSQAGAAAAAAMNGTAGAAARLRLSLKLLGATIKGHPILLIASILLSAGYAIYEYIDAINEANKAYDAEAIRNIKKIEQLEKIKDSLKEVKEEVEKNNAVLIDETQNEDALNEAREKNRKTLKRLKTEYPEYFRYLVQQIDGTIDLNDEIETQNKLLELNIALQHQAKASAFQQDLTTNYKQAEEAVGEKSAELYEIKEATYQFENAAKAYLAKDRLTEAQFNDIMQKVKQIREATTAEAASEAWVGFTNYVKSIDGLFNKIVDIKFPLDKAFRELKDAITDADIAQNDLWENIQKQMPTITEAMRRFTGDWSYQKRGKWLEDFLTQFGIVDETVRNFAKSKIVTELKEKGIQVRFNIIPFDPNDLADWQKRYNDYIKTVNFADVLKAIEDPTTEREKLGAALKSQIEDYQGIIDSYKIDGQKYFSKGNYDEATQKVKALTAAYNWLGFAIKKKKGGGSRKDWWLEMVSGLKNLHSEFLTLRKDLDATEARALALEKFKGVFDEILPKLGASGKSINIGSLNFETEEGMIDAFTALKNMSGISKEARLAIEKALTDIRGEIRLTTKAEEDKSLINTVEGMFSDYELSLDLEKLNIPPDIAKSLFNVDTMSLKELRSQVEALRPQFVGTDMEKEYEEYLKKISEMEDKAQVERLKKYSKYLVKAEGERIRIKKEELRQIAEIEALPLSESEKQLAKQNLRKETQKQLDTVAWKEFQESSMYVQLFEDLEYTSTKALNIMRDKLVQMKSELKNLDPSDLKALYAQIEKLENELATRNPLKTVMSTDYFKAVSESKKLEKQLATIGVETTNNKEKEVKLTDEIATEEAKLKKMREQGGKYSARDINDQEAKVAFLKTQLVTVREILEKNGLLTTELEQQLDKHQATKKIFNKSVGEIGAKISAYSSALPAIAGNIEGVFGSMSAGAKDAIESIAEIGSGIGTAMEGFASNNPLQVISGITQALSGFFGMGDKRRERDIKKEIEYVEQLQRSYEKLEKRVNALYNIDDVNINFKAMKDNLQEQIDSTEKMIDLEEDKKKTDHDRIKEWKKQIEDYQQQIKDLEDERINQLGGIAGGDAIYSTSQSFVDAWIEAFRETGDGLSGLEEQFDEVYMNLVKKQVLGRGVDKMLEPLYSKLNGMLEDGAMTAQEFDDFTSTWDGLSPQISEFLTNVANDLGIADDITRKNGELSGLQEGISGITEDQADILAAYWSSVRFIVSSIEQKFTEYARQMLGTDLSANPILNELKAQTSLLDEINDKLGSIIGHSGGAHVKTYLIS